MPGCCIDELCTFIDDTQLFCDPAFVIFIAKSSRAACRTSCIALIRIDDKVQPFDFNGIFSRRGSFRGVGSNYLPISSVQERVTRLEDFYFCAIWEDNFATIDDIHYLSLAYNVLVLVPVH